MASFVMLLISAGLMLYRHHQEVKARQVAITTNNTTRTDATPTSIKLFNNASNADQTTPTNNSAPSAGSSTTPKPPSSSQNKAPYTPYSCTKTILHYTTSSKIATYLGVGEVSVSGGNDGYISTCTPDSNGQKPNDATIQPVNKTIYVGDGGASLATPIHNGETYEQVYARITQPDNCGAVLTKTGDNGAYQLCVTTVMHYFGY